MLFIKDLAGQAPRSRSAPAGPQFAASWSGHTGQRDGVWAVRAGDDLVVQRVAGGRPEPLPIDTDANESDGRLSPDAQWIAYTTDQSGRDEVWVASFPSGTLRRQVSLDGGVSPQWCDSETLVYLAADRHFTVVPFRGSADGIELGDHAPLFRRSDVIRCERTLAPTANNYAATRLRPLSRSDETAQSGSRADQYRRELAGLAAALTPEADRLAIPSDDHGQSLDSGFTAHRLARTWCRLSACTPVSRSSPSAGPLTTRVKPPGGQSGRLPDARSRPRLPARTPACWCDRRRDTRGGQVRSLGVSTPAVTCAHAPTVKGIRPQSTYTGFCNSRLRPGCSVSTAARDAASLAFRFSCPNSPPSSPYPATTTPAGENILSRIPDGSYGIETKEMPP